MLVSPNEVSGSPVVVGSRVYVGIGQDPVHGPGRGALSCIAIDGTGDITKSGRVWQYTGIGRALSTVAVVDGLVYAAEYAGKVHCLDAATGRLHWVHDTREEIWSSALVVDGKVWVGTRKSLVVLAAGLEKKVLAEEKKKADAPSEFAKEMLGLAKAAGFKPLVEQFKAISDLAQRAGLKDINECETEADRHNLMEQFKTDFPACVKGKAKTQKPTKTKAAKAVKKGKKK
jgi:hypothetical protein